MHSNPYVPPPQLSDTELCPTPHKNTLAKRIIVAGIFVGLASFVFGIIWLKLLGRSAILPADITFYYTFAELVAWGGMAMAMTIGSVAGVSRLVKRLAPQSPADSAGIVFSWNAVPAAFSTLGGVAWCGLGLLGFYSLIAELKDWEYLRGMPLLEFVLQSLLYSSGLAACFFCLIAASQWMRKNYARAFLYTGLGVLGPIVVAVTLFGVCEELIRLLV